MCQSYTGGAALESWRREEDQEDQEEQEECGQHKFLELLRSMWEEEEAEQEAGGDGEEMEGGAEGRVDEEELQEIYEFATTQRKTVRKEEEEEERGNAGSETEEEEQEKEETGEDAVSPVRMSSRRHGDCGTPHGAPSEAGPPDWLSASHVTQEASEAEPAAPSTDRRSGTEGSGGDGTSRPSPGPRSCTSLDRSYEQLFSQTWGDYMEASQVSHGALIDLSVSPVPDPCDSAFPTAGVSPGSPAPEQGRAACPQISPPRPELIELSDSGDDPDAPLGPSPVPGVDSGRGEASPGDCSAEMSWLIPGTPEPPPKATRVISTQTHCSMRRTRLFATPLFPR